MSSSGMSPGGGDGDEADAEVPPRLQTRACGERVAGGGGSVMEGGQWRRENGVRETRPPFASSSSRPVQ
jgi:hypothetical protein